MKDELNPQSESTMTPEPKAGWPSYTMVEDRMKKIYFDFYHETYKKTNIDRKTKELIAIAASLVLVILVVEFRAFTPALLILAAALVLAFRRSRRFAALLLALGVRAELRSEGWFGNHPEPNLKAYLDLVSGWTRPVHIGYGRKEMAQAVADQILEMPYYTPMQFGNPRAVELAAVLATVAPPPISNFLFVSSGSEAVESALKLAKHYHHYRGERARFKMVTRRGAFHGVTGGALRVLGTVLPIRQMMEPLAPGTVFAESPYCYRCPVEATFPGCDFLCLRASLELADANFTARPAAAICSRSPSCAR